MKRICLFVLSLLLVLLLAAPAFGADADYTAKLQIGNQSDATVKIGSTVEVTLCLRNNEKENYALYSFQDCVRFDPAYLQFVSCEGVRNGTVNLCNGFLADLQGGGNYNTVFVNRSSEQPAAVSGDAAIVRMKFKTIQAGTTVLTHELPLVIEEGVSKSVAIADASLTIQAASATHTVTFETGSGTPVPSQVVGLYSIVQKPEDPVRPGFDFVGWYRDSGYNNPWNFAINTVAVDTTLYACWREAFTVEFNTGKGSAVTSQVVPSDGFANKPVTPAREGCTFGGWYKDKAYQAPWNFAKDTVKENTTLYAAWVRDGVILRTCMLTFVTNGGDAIAPRSMETGNLLDLAQYAPVRKGYDFAGWYLDEAMTQPVENLVVSGDTTFYAKWTEAVPEAPEAPATCPGDETCPCTAFKDMSPTEWYHEAADFVLSRGLMNGTSADTFSPDQAMTRGMIVTVLYRVEKSPQVEKTCPFKDVRSGSYYENAITWAAENGIVNGRSDDLFAPDENITREQISAILYRYAAYKGYNVTAAAELSGIPDSESVSAYALSAVRWAVANGMFVGSEEGLQPREAALRIHVAYMLYRFSTQVASQPK